MRTTVTLDDDVTVLLENLQARHGYRFKEALNLALREGLLRLQKPPAKRQPYRTPGVSLGKPRLPALDNVSEVLAIGEEERFR